MADDKKHKINWKVLLNIVTVLALIGLTYAVRSDVAEALKNLNQLKRFALFLMVPGQILNYHAYAQMYQDLFLILDEKVRYIKVFKLQLELNFVNNVFPSGGVSGISYFGVRMKSLGIGAGKATLVQFMKFVLVFISFQLLLGIGLIILAIDGQANGLLILVAGSLATLLLLGTVASAYIVGSKKRINQFFTFLTRIINRTIHIVRPKHPETININRVEEIFTELHENYLIIRKKPKVLVRPLVSALLVNISEVLTIYIVFVAFNQWVNPGAVIIAYAVANFAGLISVLPSGVGIYEALMTGVLASAGVPPGISIPITITYRVLNMAIQLPPGLYYYHKAVQGNKLAKQS